MPNCITCNFVYLSITTGINIQLIMKDSRKLQLDDLPYNFLQCHVINGIDKILSEYRCKEIITKLSVLSSVSKSTYVLLV